MRFKGYFSHIFFSVLFLLILSVSVISWAVKYDIKIKLVENRALAALPSYKKDISAFNKQLDKYINDNIPLRTYIISWYHYFWGWSLYSPIGSYIRGKDDNIFKIGISKSFAMRTDNPDIEYNEIAHGMYYISRYYNSDFIYILLPDKESVMQSYMPEWMQNFKKKHNILSLRELFLSQVKEPMFTFIDLYEYMNADEAGAETYFDKRRDVAHYNGKGVDLAVRLICEAINRKKQFYNCADMQLDVQNQRHSRFPYHSDLKYEYSLIAHMEGDMSSMESIPYGEVGDWIGVDYIKNHKIKSKSIFVISDSSLKSTIIIKNKNDKLKLHSKLLPFVYETSSYMHMHTSLLLGGYNAFSAAIQETKPDYIVFGVTERVLNSRQQYFMRDTVFRILGRYALGMNENFIFPEDLSSPYTPISDKDGYLSVNNISLFPLYIDKDLKTDNNGDIYVSFRYSFPKNADEAVLEWTSDKEFKTDIKRSSVKISGGGCKV